MTVSSMTCDSRDMGSLKLLGKSMNVKVNKNFFYLSIEATSCPGVGRVSE